MSLRLNSSGGGSVTLQEPVTASTRTLNLPNVDGTVITTADSGTVSSTMIAAAAVTPAKLSQPLTLATAQNTTSGTSFDFTGIPSWVRRVTFIFNGVSTTGNSRFLIQIGTASGVETSGYSSTGTVVDNAGGSGAATSTSGFLVWNESAGAATSGALVIYSISGNTWVSNHTAQAGDNNRSVFGGGNKTLAGTLDRLRLTTVSGSEAFDAGSVNIMYEG